jgi:class 3 adenylate cyclase
VSDADVSKFDTKTVLQGLDLGVALVDSTTWNVTYENARFFDWFPPDPERESLLDGRIPDVEIDKVKARLDAGRNFSVVTETRDDKRSRPIRVTVSWLGAAEEERREALVQCVDISKERQAEYLLDSYSTMAERHTKELQREKDRVEKLLLNVMPKAVYEELKDYGTTTPHRFDCASILMLDFVRFTEMTISHDASALVSELNDIFSAFDRIVEMFNCERIRTMGDSYMAVSGIPETLPDHAQNIAKVALRIKRYLERRNDAHNNEWRCRMGIHSGSVIGSLVGIQKYVYDLFGPGVNMASRMESLSEPMMITVSSATQDLLKDEFSMTERGEFDIKGFGKQPLYFLDRELTLR